MQPPIGCRNGSKGEEAVCEQIYFTKVNLQISSFILNRIVFRAGNGWYSHRACVNSPTVHHSLLPKLREG